MRPNSTDGGEVCVPAMPPHAGSPAFVAGMGHRMAAAALRPRPAVSRRAEVLPRLPTDTGIRPPVTARPTPAASQHPGFATICQIATLCVAAAGGAALLYWQKSGGGAEDREIGHLLQASQQARARTSLLRTEWAELNEPERLQDLADRTLALRPIAPAQFVAPEQLHAWLQAPASVAPTSPAPAPDPAAEPGIPDAAVVPSFRPASRPRLVAMALPSPPVPPLAAPPHPRGQRLLPVMLATLPEPSPGPRLVRAAAASRFELPRWLTQAPPRRPTALVMSEPPHALVLPPPSRPAVAVADPWPAPARSFVVVAASPGAPPYDDHIAGWGTREALAPWPYGLSSPTPYGWAPAY